MGSLTIAPVNLVSPSCCLPAIAVQHPTQSLSALDRFAGCNGEPAIHNRAITQPLVVALAMIMFYKLVEAWSRPGDTAGLAVVVNGISAVHRQFLTNGGLGITVGDGKLDYGKEEILETYYSIATRWGQSRQIFSWSSTPPMTATVGLPRSSR